MDLWIRSQDKEELIKVDYLYIPISQDQEHFGIYTKNGIIDMFLGIYKTKERALEVLDEINEHIEKQGQTIVITNEKGIADELKYYGKTYVMPKE